MRPNVLVFSVLAFALVAGTLFASFAHAAPQCGAFGCNLRWDHCYGDGGIANRNFACDTNAGVDILVGSFVPGVDVGSVSGLTLILDLASASPTLPAWWQFRNTGSCRQVSANVSGSPSDLPVACPEWSAEAAENIVFLYSTGVSGSPNRARMLVVTAVQAADAQNLFAQHEYFACNFLINHAKTVGAGSCAGCQTPVCMVVQSVDMSSTVPGNGCWVSGPANHVDSNVATWQGGGVPVVGDKVGCPAATPTRPSSWGAVKSLYR